MLVGEVRRGSCDSRRHEIVLADATQKIGVVIERDASLPLGITTTCWCVFKTRRAFHSRERRPNFSRDDYEKRTFFLGSFSKSLNRQTELACTTGMNRVPIFMLQQPDCGFHVPLDISHACFVRDTYTFHNASKLTRLGTVLGVFAVYLSC